LIAKQAIVVQGKSAAPSLLLQSGWKIGAAPGFENIFQQESTERPPRNLVATALQSLQPVPVLWQDDWLVAIDKPAGMPSHPLKTDEHNTALHALLSLQPSIAAAGPKALEGGLIHRLDTQTSGVLIAACTPAAFEHLVNTFRQHKATKIYLALVYGELARAADKELVISIPIAHHLQDSRRMVVVSEQQVDEATAKQAPFRGKPRKAESRVRLLSATKKYSLLKVTVQQAQMHQIRVHLSALGHPLVADAIYASRIQRQTDESGMQRHALHAARIVLPHPADGHEITIEAALPDDMRRACERLGLGV